MTSTEEYKRVLILSSTIGGGHISVANALKRSFEGPNLEVEVKSPIGSTDCMGMLPVVYGFLVRNARTAWRLFFFLRRFNLGRKFVRRFVRWRATASVLDAIDAGYDAIVITHSLYCDFLPEIVLRSNSVVVVVTDLYGGPLEWFQLGAQKYVVLSKAMFDEAIRMGVRSEDLMLRKLKTSGNAQELVSQEVDMLQAGRCKVLVVSGSDGSGPVLKVVRGLAQRLDRIELTVVCGRNEKLRSKLGEIFGLAIEVHGFVEDLPQRMPGFDLIVSKPGAQSLMEIIECKRPCVVLPGIPGIENANFKFMTSLAGIPSATSARSIKRVLDRLVGADGVVTDEFVGIVESISKLSETFQYCEIVVNDLFESVD